MQTSSPTRHYCCHNIDVRCDGDVDVFTLFDFARFEVSRHKIFYLELVASLQLLVTIIVDSVVQSSINERPLTLWILTSLQEADGDSNV